MFTTQKFFCAGWNDNIFSIRWDTSQNKLIDATQDCLPMHVTSLVSLDLRDTLPISAFLDKRQVRSCMIWWFLKCITYSHQHHEFFWCTQQLCYTERSVSTQHKSKSSKYICNKSESHVMFVCLESFGWRLQKNTSFWSGGLEPPYLCRSLSCNVFLNLTHSCRLWWVSVCRLSITFQDHLFDLAMYGLCYTCINIWYFRLYSKNTHLFTKNHV